jgi:hypothetical protein
MSNVASPALSKLREELRALVSQTLSLAAASRFRRSFASGGGVVAALEPDANQTAQAAAHQARLTRWRDAVDLLLRRHAVPAGDLHELVEQAETYVLLQCRTPAETTESRWRRTVADDLTRIALALEQLLDSCDRAFVVVEQERVFEFLDVHVENTSTDVHILLKTSAGELRGNSVIPFTKYEQDVLIQDTCAPKNGEVVIDRLTAFGQMLFALTFGGALRDAYSNARARAGSRGATLLLRLHLEAAGRLASVPWELLHDGSRFVCLQRGTVLTRCTGTLSTPAARYKPDPLRVLVTISTPQTLRWLDTARERRLLEAALGPLEMLGLVRVDVAPDGTFDTMRRMLRNAENAGAPYAVWHYVGHGAFDNATGRTQLALTAENGLPHLIGGQELDVIFAGHTAPRLVVLNACHTARGPSDDPAAIVGALGACGVPAVVAMQFAISDAAAITFAEETYGALAAGEDVLAAVTEARRAIFARTPGCEWMTPVIFTGRNGPETH